MKPQQRFRAGDRAWTCDDSNSNGQLKAGEVHYVFYVIETTPQRLILHSNNFECVWDADRFDRMRPAHLLK